jgi:hypothetical protein
MYALTNGIQETEEFNDFKSQQVALIVRPLTAEHRFADEFLIGAEYRRDTSSEPFFPGPSGSADLRRAQPTALIGAIWVFGSKKGTW